jgi:hypothetical protein
MPPCLGSASCLALPRCSGGPCRHQAVAAQFLCLGRSDLSAVKCRPLEPHQQASGALRPAACCSLRTDASRQGCSRCGCLLPRWPHVAALWCMHGLRGRGHTCCSATWQHSPVWRCADTDPGVQGVAVVSSTEGVPKLGLRGTPLCGVPPPVEHATWALLWQCCRLRRWLARGHGCGLGVTAPAQLCAPGLHSRSAAWPFS